MSIHTQKLNDLNCHEFIFFLSLVCTLKDNLGVKHLAYNKLDWKRLFERSHLPVSNQNNCVIAQIS
jgi:hypothetical protein